MEGDLEASADEVQKAIDLVPVEAPDYVRQEVISRQVRIYLAQHRFAAAQMAFQRQGFSFENGFSFPALPSGQSVSYSMGSLYNSSLYALLYQVRTRGDLEGLEPGLELANQLIVVAFQDQQLLLALEALLLRAQIYAALGDSQAGAAANLNASQSDYIRALELAEPEGFIGIFVEQGPPAAEALASLIEQNRLGTVQTDYVERILAAFSSLQSPATMHGEQHAQDRPAEVGPAALVESLTDRELEVLGLMAEGLRYKEIAAKLFISLNTVRFHVKTIYGKLGVNNRTKAVEKARQLRIL
jgi:LuxR family maltose regulon positive regulatory protein